MDVARYSARPSAETTIKQFLGEEIMRFDYVRYDEIAIAKQGDFKSNFEALAALTNATLPEGRAKSLVMTKLEEAYMWVGKGLRDEQVQREEAKRASI